MPPPRLTDYFDDDDIRRIRRRRPKQGDHLVRWIWKNRNSKNFSTYVQWYDIAKDEQFSSFYAADPSKKTDDLTTFDYLLNAMAGRNPYDEFQRGETAK
jgi:hypothetical protein